jgi:hypothetical protein
MTYDGNPLYRYVGDRDPLHGCRQNVREFGGLWRDIRPNSTLL